MEFFLESCFVLVTFKNVLFKYGYWELFPVKIWSLWQKKIQNNPLYASHWIFFVRKSVKFQPKEKRTLALKLQFSDFFPTTPNL